MWFMYFYPICSGSDIYHRLDLMGSKCLIIWSQMNDLDIQDMLDNLMVAKIE